VYSSPLQAYETVNKTTMSGREIEAAVLNQGALKLKECQESWHADDRDERLEAALNFNQQIWTILQGELVKADNSLPKQIRQNLLTLSAYVDKRIFEIMAFPSPEKLNIVIDINRNIAAGLIQATSNPR
jgi:flagellar biosynthesis activator protein FlaF